MGRRWQVGPLRAGAVVALGLAGLGACGASASAGTGTRPEAVGGTTHTWTDYRDAGGDPGPVVATGRTVAVACRLHGFKVADGDTWWYRIASAPWDGRYYASADAFYNDGRDSGTLEGTPLFDPRVPLC